MRERSERANADEAQGFTRCEPPCPYFGICGGCALQDLAYPDQLTLKRARVRRVLAAFGAAGAGCEITGLEPPWRYRSKAELSFAGGAGSLALGYHAARSFLKVVDLGDCLLLPEAAVRMLNDVRALANASGLPAYHPRTHEGFFRYLILRSSQATGRLLACVVTASGPQEVMEEMGAELLRRHPDLAGISWGITDRVADVARPERLVHLAGDTHLDERVGRFRLRLSPSSFLQPSTVQADRIYRAILEQLPRETGGGPPLASPSPPPCGGVPLAGGGPPLASPSPPPCGGVAWDLYCGVGLISLYLGDRFGRVYGIDAEPEHLALAREHAVMNGATNLDFRTGDVGLVLLDRRFWLQEARPDVVIADPPRVGLDRRVIASILAARPGQVVYLSCNLGSLVRDLAALTAGFPRYRLVRAQAFDLFPQTNHVETLAWLSRA